jgi:hypothetical protein
VTAQTFRLGDRVKYANGLERGYGVEDEKSGRQNYARKEWHTVKRRKYDDNYLLEGEGVVVGMRTYSNGKRYWDEDGATYTPDETFRVVLVAFSLFRNPAAVRFEDVELLQGSLDIDGVKAGDRLIVADDESRRGWPEPLDGIDFEGDAE